VPSSITTPPNWGFSIAMVRNKLGVMFYLRNKGIGYVSTILACKYVIFK